MTNEQEEIDIEVENHLQEARLNRDKNAHMLESAMQKLSE